MNTPTLPPEPRMSDMDLDFLEPAVRAALHLADDDEDRWERLQDADIEAQIEVLQTEYREAVN